MVEAARDVAECKENNGNQYETVLEKVPLSQKNKF